MEHIVPMIDFKYSPVTIKVRGERLDSPPNMILVDYEILVNSDDNDRKCQLMHESI